MSCLSDITKCIHSSALIVGIERNYLEEKATKTKVQLNTGGQYLLYDFERIKKPLFPFFENNSQVKGLNAIADKILFSEDSKGKIWVFIIELKQGKGDPKKQLFATKQLIMFILDSINRIVRPNIKLRCADSDIQKDLDRQLGLGKFMIITTLPSLAETN